jgi:hypothetical protein
MGFSKRDLKSQNTAKTVFIFKIIIALLSISQMQEIHSVGKLVEKTKNNVWIAAHGAVDVAKARKTRLHATLHVKISSQNQKQRTVLEFSTLGHAEWR